MYVQNKFMKHIDFLLKVRMDSIPNFASFVSIATFYFSLNRIYANVCIHYFYTMLFV